VEAIGKRGKRWPNCHPCRPDFSPGTSATALRSGHARGQCSVAGRKFKSPRPDCFKHTCFGNSFRSTICD
jgi:hypothetical protein